MTFQVLVATMNQTEYSLLERMNIQSDAIVVNQCNKNEKHIFEWNGYTIVWINSTERGLSHSRNMALDNANADICLLCDDDEVLKESYREYILAAYAEVPQADMLVFNIEKIDCAESEKLFTKVKAIPNYKTYGSVHLTFKRKKIIDHGIWFNTNFGTGSGKYSSCEDAIFCMEIHKRGLKSFVYPLVIATVSYAESSWFNGYNEKYFYDMGAYLAEVYPKMKWIMKWYYPFRLGNLTSLKTGEIIKYISYGIRGYRNKLCYEDYMKGL